jgi:HK97 family phage major capsid protein
MSKPLSERIGEAETELVEMKDQLVEATKSLEAAPDESSLLIEVEELTSQVEKKSATLDALKKAEAALAARAKPVEAANVATDLAKHRKGEQLVGKGDLFLKHATAQFIGFVEKKDPMQVMDERYGDTPIIKESFDYIRKSAVNPAMTSTSGWAAELVQTDTRGFLEAIEDVSVFAQIASMSTSLDFGGYNSVTIPTENQLPATPTEPSWVAEGRPIPLTQFGFGSTTINRYKLGAITTFTRELAERSTPQIEGLLRNSLRKAYARVMDQAMLSATPAVANVRPDGLLQGVTATAGTAGGGDAAVRGDILGLLSKMTANRLGSKPVLIMNNLDRLAASMMVSSLSDYLFRDELASGMLMGMPIISSAIVPQNTLILADMDTIVTAIDAPMFDVSDVATIMEASANTSAPTMVADQSGAAGTAAGQVGTDEGIMVQGTDLSGAAATGVTGRSLWQTYSVGIRMVAPVSWERLRGKAGIEASDSTTWS